MSVLKVLKKTGVQLSVGDYFLFISETQFTGARRKVFAGRGSMMLLKEYFHNGDFGVEIITMECELVKARLPITKLLRLIDTSAIKQGC